MRKNVSLKKLYDKRGCSQVKVLKKIGKFGRDTKTNYIHTQLCTNTVDSGYFYYNPAAR